MVSFFIYFDRIKHNHLSVILSYLFDNQYMTFSTLICQ